MTALKLSVAMCTYNGARFLDEQLHSIAAQTRPPDELVVCDDQSSDGTIEIVRAWTGRFACRVRVECNPINLGTIRNFERAISLCDGELIALADQDDVWEPQKLETLERALVNTPGCYLTFCDGEVVDEDLRSMNRRLWEAVRFGPRERHLFEAGRALEVLLHHNVVTGAAMLFHRDLRKLASPFPVNVIHDGWRVIHDGWLALLAAAVSRIVPVAQPLIKYRQHSGQQLGVRSAFEPANQAADGLRSAMQRRNSFEGEIYYLNTIAARLRTHEAEFSVGNSLSELESKLGHLQTRSGMAADMSRRLPVVLRELVSSRYHRYSNGFSSAAKDLWLGNRAA